MAALASFRSLADDARATAFASALLHDVSKPDCTRTGDDGRVTSHGHSIRGAISARRILYGMGAPFAAREQVSALLRHHQAPFWLIERDDPLRLVVYVEVPERMLRAQNRARKRPVPERVIDELLDKWEVPDVTEAHAVEHVVR